MQLRIIYDSTWRNSFLDGSNNVKVPKNGRAFIGSITKIKKGSFIQHQISKDTVMGVLNRLIGDQRKLYQAREDRDTYYFAELESKIKFLDLPDKQIQSSEIVYLRNISGSTDQNSFTGMIKADNAAFNSQFSASLWNILYLEINDLCKFILNASCDVSATQSHDPVSVITQLEQLNKLKPLIPNAQMDEAILELKRNFLNVEFVNKDNLINPISLYCSALYLQILRLGERFDLSSILTKSGGLSGISKRGFTKKDFMDRFTTGPKKQVWGNPYLQKIKKKGEGEIVSKLTKACGILEISIDIPYLQAQEFKEMIEYAGVSSFSLGKKGLAYLDYDSIRLEQL